MFGQNNGHEQTFRLSSLKPFYAISQVTIPRWFSSKTNIDSQVSNLIPTKLHILYMTPRE
jgi:hypothetical protein